MNMIEKVARGIYAEYEYGLKHPEMLAIMHKTAKAAIQAMLEPTEEMIKVGKVCCMEECIDKYGVGKTYQSMIQAALKD